MPRTLIGMRENTALIVPRVPGGRSRSAFGSRTVRAWVWIAALGFALGGALAPAPPAVAAEADTIHALVNDARSANGLSGLVRNPALDSVAASWASQLAASGALSHNPSVGAQIPGGWTSWGENVAQGHPTGAAMHAGWMDSPGHRANVLGDFTDLGVAFIAAGGTTWGVEVFATYPGSGGAPPAAATPVEPPPAAEAPPAPPAAPAPAPAPDPEPSPSPSASASTSPSPSSSASPSARERPSPTPRPSSSPDAAAVPAGSPGDADPTPLAASLLAFAAIAASAFAALRARSAGRHPKHAGPDDVSSPDDPGE